MPNAGQSGNADRGQGCAAYEVRCCGKSHEGIGPTLLPMQRDDTCGESVRKGHPRRSRFSGVGIIMWTGVRWRNI
jgi:hypothetical protein